MEISELTMDGMMDGDEGDQTRLAAAHHVVLPGPFVVLQGIAGDGLPNTIESVPNYYPCDDDHSDGEAEEEVVFYQDNNNSHDNNSDDNSDDDDDDDDDGPEELAPLEEDHFHPGVEILSAALTTNSNHSSSSNNPRSIPVVGLPAASSRVFSSSLIAPGGLLLSHLAKTSGGIGMNTGGLPFVAPAATTQQPQQKYQRRQQESSSTSGSSSQQSPPNNKNTTSNEESFVVVQSAPATPTRIHMYQNQNTANGTPSNTNTNTNTNNTTQRDRRKRQAIEQWSQEMREEQLGQREEWLLQERQRLLQQEQRHQEQQRQQQQRLRPGQRLSRGGNTTNAPDAPGGVVSPFASHGASINNNTSNSSNDNHDWWLDAETGHLAVFEQPPVTSPLNIVLAGNQVGTLAPGSTLVAQKLIALDSETLQVLHVDDGTDDNGSRTQAPLEPSIGVIQLLQFQWAPVISSTSATKATAATSAMSPPTSLRNLSMVASEDNSPKKKSASPSSSRQQQRQSAKNVAYCVYSVHGYSLLVPGIPASYMDPTVWWWRVTCKVGAFLRQGLELSSDHITTLPHGAFVRVTRKTVNRAGLSRLRVVASYPDHANNNKDGQHRRVTVEGWCSELLNPLSGQRGHVVQPLPYMRPALYRVTLKEGAVIREHQELSSPQIGRASYGTVLTIVAHHFSEHPQDQCVERLKLAGGEETGWISVRLNQAPPDDKCVVELMGADESFDPNQPGHYHWGFLQKQYALRLQQQRQDAAAFSGSPSSSSGGLSSIDGGEDDSPRSSNRKATSGTKNGLPSRAREKYNRQQAEKCLICLTEERNATIVHGETGHIACCLVCARILKARGDRCPVCRLGIDSVIQHFWA